MLTGSMEMKTCAQPRMTGDLDVFIEVRPGRRAIRRVRFTWASASCFSGSALSRWDWHSRRGLWLSVRIA